MSDVLSQFSQFVRNELVRLPPDRALHIDSKGAWIRCPLHSGGMEKTPSFMITLSGKSKYPVGSCYCFGCKEYLNWNDFASLFGLTVLRSKQLKALEKVATTQYKVEDKNSTLPDLTCMNPWPETVYWRTIPGKVVNMFQGKQIMMGHNPVMYLPVTVFSEQIGGINCLMSKPKNKQAKSYINSTGDWSHKALIGFDLALKKPNTPLWVVEGPRDTMRIYQGKARAVGLIGAAVTKEKIRLIRELEPSVVLCATDPDDAGDSAKKALKQELSNEFPFRSFPFEEGEDAADLLPHEISSTTKQLSRQFA